MDNHDKQGEIGAAQQGREKCSRKTGRVAAAGPGELPLQDRESCAARPGELRCKTGRVAPPD
ncbi:hypothetical protein [Paenibacillus donghaensis]|uniref:Uncharacterized protein n=1 Tax=Paenibacillus donghaensis TaxID=414771 RepID=A0A2Z2KM70_9BACL|nr:hypothetical protein [Paenibacillus donghaensis]ASA24543.1 hypothetical protein B9T62_29590 [Paenibacillus donghaensis]